jgi:hypothetical protein
MCDFGQATAQINAGCAVARIWHVLSLQVSADECARDATVGREILELYSFFGRREKEEGQVSPVPTPSETSVYGFGNLQGA